jgi:hypothetical protein
MASLGGHPDEYTNLQATENKIGTEMTPQD